MTETKRVRHRLDDLENSSEIIVFGFDVRHRLDDLEKLLLKSRSTW